MTLLRLVVSNSSTSQENGSFSSPSIPNAPEFAIDIKDRGSFLYEMTASDPLHGLTCILTLEVEEDPKDPETNIVICHLSNVFDDALVEWVEHTNPLYRIVTTQFQMKIVEQLLLFCTTHRASRLIIYRDRLQTQAHNSNEDFWDRLEQMLTKKPQSSKLVISFQPETLETLIELMDQTNLKLKQDLWYEQRSNLAIRQYLTSHPFG